MDTRRTVFICGTSSDLVSERQAVLEAVRRLSVPARSMEIFGANPERSIKTCLDQVAKSDVLVVIVGHRYGHIVPERGISYSEAEYNEGYRLGKECLVYTKGDVRVFERHVEQDSAKRDLLAKWKNTLRERHMTYTFRSSNDLAKQLIADLGRLPPLTPGSELLEAAGQRRRAGDLHVMYMPGHEYPAHRPSRLLGREGLLDQLSRWFEGDQGKGPPLLVVRAQSGFGKSHLAWHWVDLVLPELPAAGSLSCSPIWWNFSKGTAEEFLEFTLRVVGAGTYDDLFEQLRAGRLLLVLDALEQRLWGYASREGHFGKLDFGREEVPSDRALVDEEMGEFLARVAAHEKLAGRILVTSREIPDQLPLGPAVVVVELLGIEDAAAAQLLSAFGVQFSDYALKELMEKLGGHPLGLWLAALNITAPGGTDGSLDRWLESQSSTGGLVAELGKHFEPTWERLSGPAQRVLAEIAIPRTAVDFARICKDSELQDADVKKSLSELERMYLLQKGRRTGDAFSPYLYDMHAIIRWFAFGKLGSIWGEGQDALWCELKDLPPGKDRLLGPPPDPGALGLMDLFERRFRRLARAGRVDEAIALFQARLAYHLFYTESNYEKAADLLTPLVFQDGSGGSDPWSPKSEVQAWAANALANCRRYLGQPGAAAQLHSVVLEWDRSSGAEKATNLANRQGNLGIDLRFAGDLDGAVEHLREAVAIAEQAAEVSTVASLAAELAFALIDLRELEEALEAAEQAMKAAREISEYRGKALLARASALRDLGRLDEALATALEAKRALDEKESQNQRVAFEVRLALADLYIRRSEITAARDPLRQAEELAKEQLRFPPLIWQLQVALTRATAAGVVEDEPQPLVAAEQASKAGFDLIVPWLWLAHAEWAHSRGRTREALQILDEAQAAAGGRRVNLTTGEVLQDETRRPNARALKELADVRRWVQRGGA